MPPRVRPSNSTLPREPCTKNGVIMLDGKCYLSDASTVWDECLPWAEQRLALGPLRGWVGALQARVLFSPRLASGRQYGCSGQSV